MNQAVWGPQSGERETQKRFFNTAQVLHVGDMAYDFHSDNGRPGVQPEPLVDHDSRLQF